jgi:septum formation protein
MDNWIYLASASPRRRQLLEQIGVGYRLLSIDIPEQPGVGESPEEFVLRLALEKARAGREQLEQDDDHPVLGADTAVVLDGRILGKPRDRNHALQMLSQLSGHTHQVLSGVALVGADGEEASRLSVSRVRFRTLASGEIDHYWESGEPADKAGSYAIQGRAAAFIERLEGSYSGVMGLPLFETAELLGEYGVYGI